MAEDDLSPLEAELADVERAVQRRVEPGALASGVVVGIMMLVASLALPWTGSTRGFEVLFGQAELGERDERATFRPETHPATPDGPTVDKHLQLARDRLARPQLQAAETRVAEWQREPLRHDQLEPLPPQDR